MRLILGLTSLLVLVGCNDPASFNGDAGSRQTGKEIIPTPPGEQCEKREEVQPGDILFLIDNSGSMATSDPDRARLATVQDTISTLSKLLPEDEQDKIQFSARVFTPRQRGDTETFTLTDWRGAGVSPAFWRNLSNDLPRADGDTPYRNAIAEADAAFSRLGDAEAERRRTVIFITDGDPTDRDPAAVRSAHKLGKQSAQYEWSTIYIRGSSSPADRRSRHSEVMRQYEESWQRQSSTGSTWRIGFDTEVSYIDSLMTLAQDISDSYFEVDDSEGLRQLIAEEIVQKKMLGCSN